MYWYAFNLRCDLNVNLIHEIFTTYQLESFSCYDYEYVSVCVCMHMHLFNHLSENHFEL